MPFNYVNVICEQGKFTTSVYCKPTISRISTDSFLPSTYKIGMIYTLLYRCFQICSDWTKFHFELVKLMDVFTSNGYHENFIINSFKAFLHNKHRAQERVMTALKNLFLILPYLTPLSFQIRNKLRKYLKGIFQLLQITDCVQQSK